MEVCPGGGYRVLGGKWQGVGALGDCGVEQLGKLQLVLLED